MHISLVPWLWRFYHSPAPHIEESPWCREYPALYTTPCSPRRSLFAPRYSPSQGRKCCRNSCPIRTGTPSSCSSRRNSPLWLGSPACRQSTWGGCLSWGEPRTLWPRCREADGGSRLCVPWQFRKMRLRETCSCSNFFANFLKPAQRNYIYVICHEFDRSWMNRLRK